MQPAFGVRDVDVSLSLRSRRSDGTELIGHQLELDLVEGVGSQSKGLPPVDRRLDLSRIAQEAAAAGIELLGPPGMLPRELA